jgi:hypothetical protein
LRLGVRSEHGLRAKGISFSASAYQKADHPRLQNSR